jgi:sec-independent protein translocase protein TatB
VFGIGGSEILVILIIALLFLGPDKLPDAAKQLSKGIRDLKKHSRILTQTIENDETIGGALRDIKSALRGDEIAPRPVKKPVVQNKIEGDKPAGDDAAKIINDAAATTEAEIAANDKRLHEADLAKEQAKITLPPTAGQPNAEDSDLKGTHDASELAAMIKPAPGETVKREEPTPPAEEEPKQKHG